MKIRILYSIPPSNQFLTCFPAPICLRSAVARDKTLPFLPPLHSARSFSTQIELPGRRRCSGETAADDGGRGRKNRELFLSGWPPGAAMSKWGLCSSTELRRNCACRRVWWGECCTKLAQESICFVSSVVRRLSRGWQRLHSGRTRRHAGIGPVGFTCDAEEGGGV